ncbi:MAG TPA: hypothetical protein VG711_10905, partial [Phycisphaerales bacterium]|nr:hypothetical protein [Phycisphaerales bacterium]
MDQHWSQSTPNGPQNGPASISATGSMQPRPQVVQIVTKSGGLKWVFWMVIGLFLFGGVFIIGLVLGAGFVAAATGEDSLVYRREYRAGPRGHIDILPVEGEINGSAAEYVHDAVEDILSRGKADAVILRVDSPGGEVAASDQIWHEIERLKIAG